MLPSRRAFHPTMYAAGILSRFPAWMKLHNKDSVGYRFTDAILGNELELFANTLQIYKDYTSIVRSPIDTLEYLSQIELPYFLKESTIYTTEDIPIYVVQNEMEFLNNIPTRIANTLSRISPSGLDGANIVGLEWLDGFPSGVLAIKRDVDDITPSSLLYYDIISKTNSISLTPSSGIILGVGYVGLGQNASWDEAIPESTQSLRSKYPINSWITISGDVSSTMPSGVTWDKQSFIYPETDIKTYFQRLLNNPYGSGVYDQADIELVFAPIPGTIKVYDVFNTTVSGTATQERTPTLIPSSGWNVYQFTSGYYAENDYGELEFRQHPWTYKGYDNPIPWEITPKDIQDEIIAREGSGVPIVPTLIGNVSWRLLPSGGYVDDEVFPHSGTFNWIDGTSGSGNIIRFSGHFSKYEVHYQYRLYENITQISADPKESYKPATPSGGPLYFITNTDFFQNIHIETSLSDANAIRIDPYSVRPGVTLYYTLRMNTKFEDIWDDARTTDKTVQFYKHNIGYTDNLGLRNG
ncbi:MAG TPA: hypothetical protein VI911_11145 [Patescibacteria group bacterium]|nr:hypothetical protein [Patescibacteria group bacterium]